MKHGAETRATAATPPAQHFNQTSLTRPTRVHNFAALALLFDILAALVYFDMTGETLECTKYRYER